MIGEAFNAACNYASAAAFAVSGVGVEAPAVDISEIPVRAEIVSMSLNEPGVVPSVYKPEIANVSNDFTPSEQSSSCAFNVDTDISNMMNPPADSDMQVRYLNEDLKQDYSPNAMA